MYIYLITNTVNGKQYVGQTRQSVRERFRWHMAAYERTTTPLARAVRKYGPESFTVTVLEKCSTIEQLGDAEARWIHELGTLAPNGYNVRPGGFHAPLALETRRKIGEAGKGRVFSPERNAKISRALKGREFTPEWREKISQAGTGRKLTLKQIEALRAGRRAAPNPSQAGEDNGHATLTWAQVREIRAKRAVGRTQQSLADEYGITQAAVSKIVLRQRWWPEPTED